MVILEEKKEADGVWQQRCFIMEAMWRYLLHR